MICESKKLTIEMENWKLVEIIEKSNKKKG
jgi:hypothetical protein